MAKQGKRHTRTWFVGKWNSRRRRRFSSYRQAVAYLERLRNQKAVRNGEYMIDHNGPEE